MLKGKENIYPIYISLISFLLTIISKICDNSFISLILLKKNTSFFILYFSSLLSSLILNIIPIIIGIIIRIFMDIDIITNFFIIIVFSLYGFMSVIIACQTFSLNEEDDKKKLIEGIMNESSEENSERPTLKIKSKSNKNEMEIELDNLGNDDSMDEKSDKNNSNKINKLKNEKNDFCNCLYSLIFIEAGEKIQIFNMSLSSKYENILYLIIGNFLGNMIINAISILYGLTIIEKNIKNIFLILECIAYLSIAGYYIYLSF